VYCVRIPFRVSELADAALEGHLVEVRDALARHDHILDVATEPGSSPGAVTIRAEVAVDDADDAGRTAIKAVKAAVKAVGPELWKRWELDGPTRVTPA
jgi:hypothetical protein